MEEFNGKIDNIQSRNRREKINAYHKIFNNWGPGKLLFDL
jgi:hypothetical protein